MDLSSDTSFIATFIHFQDILEFLVDTLLHYLQILFLLFRRQKNAVGHISYLKDDKVVLEIEVISETVNIDGN